MVYTYDRLNRLTDEEILDPTNGDETISYTYDNFGNRITKTDAEKTIVYTYDDNGRLRHEIGPDHLVSYQYDDNGNTIEKSDGENTTTYGYDQENRLVTARTPEHYLEYQYDMNGIRIASAVDGVLTRYIVDKNRDYAQVLEERDADGNLIVSYVYGDDLISQNRNGLDSWYHYDGQMSVRQLTDSAGNVTYTYTYDAFGVLRYQTGDTENNFMYAGESLNAITGFYYLRARWMNSEVGRFVTADPWKGDLRYPMSLNKYVYTENNPANKIDPTGKSSIGSEMITQFLIEKLNKLAIKKINDLFNKQFYKISTSCKNENYGREATKGEYLTLWGQFPKLNQKEIWVTDPFDPNNRQHLRSYNCIAFSVGNTTDWIYQDVDSNRDNNYTLPEWANFYANFDFFFLVGVSAHNSDIALFKEDAKETFHAAKRYNSNCWESKLGYSMRILHELDDITGSNYGYPITYYKYIR